MENWKPVGIVCSTAITTNLPQIQSGTIFTDREFSETLEILLECKALRMDRDPLYGGENSPTLRYLMNVEPWIRRRIHKKAKSLVMSLGRPMKVPELKILHTQVLKEIKSDAKKHPQALMKLLQEAGDKIYMSCPNAAKLLGVNKERLATALTRFRREKSNNFILKENPHRGDAHYLYELKDIISVIQNFRKDKSPADNEMDTDK